MTFSRFNLSPFDRDQKHQQHNAMSNLTSSGIHQDQRRTHAMKVLSDNDGTMRQIKRLVQVQRQKQRQKKGDYLGAPGQSTKNFRTSGDQYSLLNEVIGIRRSMQNIDYKTTCLTCCNSEALGSYKSCPRCNTLLDSQLNMRQKQARLADIDENPLLSSRSNNC